jgi:hypothetical protein
VNNKSINAFSSLGKLLKIPLVLSFLFYSFFSIAKAPKLNLKQLENPPARIIRTCCSFGVDVSYVGMPFVKKSDISSMQQIGPHYYLGNKRENNGIIYTKHGGFIDLGHLRDCADWTAYIYSYIQFQKEKGTNEILFLGLEGGPKHLALKIPDYFTTEDEFQIAGRIAYDLSIWHEIATWFGASYIPLIPERYSSFSPEDLYSNLLGVEIGIEALASPLPYEEAMTEILKCKLAELEASETVLETYYAMVGVERLWWSNKKALPSKEILILRYLETVSDSYLIPWLIPQIETHEALKIMKPDASYSSFYTLNIKLNFKIPVQEIFKEKEDRIIDQSDFEEILFYIQKDIKSKVI